MIVLLVEDDETIRESIADLLTDEGYVVAGVENGKQALDWLEGNPRPCVILLDLYMPIMSGMEFRARQIQDPALAAIPVVVVSAVDGERLAAMQIVEHVRKPIDIEHLLAVVCAHCAPRPPAER